MTDQPTHNDTFQRPPRNVITWQYLLFFITAVCLLGVVIPAKAQITALSTPVSIRARQMTLPDFLQLLRQKAAFPFFFQDNPADPSARITLHASGVPLSQVLKDALQQIGWEYEVYKNIVILRRQHSGNAAPPTAVSVTGQVIDSSRQPIPGVRITDLRSGHNTITDEQGRFQLQLPTPPQLSICALGFACRLIAPGNDTTMTIQLQPMIQKVKEVIVTGYQRINSQEMTGAVYKTNMSQLQVPGVTRTDQLLQGRIPGAAVTFPSGGVGTVPAIRIRGTATLLGNREPLWVVDGIIRDNPFPLRQANQLQLLSIRNKAADDARLSISGNSMTGLNPDDIQDITVLKDAAATAIYGSRAANGVIVITTRTGKAGPPQLFFRTDVTVTDKPRYRQLNRMNSAQRVALSKEIYEKGIIFPDDQLPETGYEGALLRLLNRRIDQATFNREVEQLERNNTDWLDQLFRNGVSRNTYLSMSGGDHILTYFGSVGLTNEQGNATGNEMNRITTNFSTRATIFPFLQAGFHLNTAHYRTEGFFDGLNPYEYALNTNRVIRPNEFYYASLGESYQPADFINDKPLLGFNYLHEREHTRNVSDVNTVNLSLQLEARIGKHLRWESIYAWGADDFRNRRSADDQSFAAALSKGYTLLSGTMDNSILRQDSIGKKTMTWRNILHYELEAGNRGQHRIQVMAGTELRRNRYRGYTTDSSSVASASKVNSIFNFFSLFSGVTYAYAQKYILSLNARTDASNRFAIGSPHRFNPVWSAGLRWNIRGEPWLQHASWLSELALRTSFGYQGNTVEYISPNLLAGRVTPENDPFSGQPLLGISNIPYTDLRWERTRSFNLGADIALGAQQLRLTFDYYNKMTEDVILKQAIPDEYGQPEAYINGGNIQNQGWEAALNWTPVASRNWNWQLQFIAGVNQNRIYNTRSVPTVAQLVEGTAVVNGKPVGGRWSFPYAGLDGTDGKPLFYYLDKNPDPARLQGNDPTAYLVYSGSGEPVFTGGMHTSLRYRRFGFSTGFSLLLGYEVRQNPLISAGSGGYYRPPAPDKNTSSELADRWQQPGDERYTNVPAIYSFKYYPENYSVGKSFRDLSLSKDGANLYRYDLYNYSDQRSINAGSLRCNYITLSYCMPLFKGMQVSASVNNVFSITDKRLRGQDPELRSMSATTSSATLPRYRGYTISISMKI